MKEYEQLKDVLVDYHYNIYADFFLSSWSLSKCVKTFNLTGVIELRKSVTNSISFVVVC